MTRLAIASAGNSVIHQYGSISVQYWLICAAQSGEGGATPNPRKASEATAKIAYPSRTVNSTTTSGKTFGRISENMMYGARSPRSRAAWT